MYFHDETDDTRVDTAINELGESSKLDLSDDDLGDRVRTIIRDELRLR